MSGFVNDLRYAFRAVFKNPRFSLVAVGALALGIGANAAIFSVVNAVLLQPLPYPDAPRLVRVCRDFHGTPQCAESIPKYLAASRAPSFDAVAAYDFAGPGLNLGGGDRPEQIKGIHVSEGYFRVFGAVPEVGRTFSAQEDTPGGPRVAVITHKLWASRFASDPQVVGRSISLNGDAYSVIGILPPRFRSEPESDVFIPLQAGSQQQQGALPVRRRARRPGATSAPARRGPCRRAVPQSNPKWMGTTNRRASSACSTSLSAGRPALHDPARRGRPRAAHRLRERGQPAGRAPPGGSAGCDRAAIGEPRADMRQLLLESLLLRRSRGPPPGHRRRVGRRAAALSPATCPADDLVQGRSGRRCSTGA